MTRVVSITTPLALAMAFAIACLFAPQAYAQDASVEASASVEVTGNVKRPDPLHVLKAEAERKRLEAQAQIEQKRGEAANLTKSYMDKKRIELKGEVDARLDVRKEGAAQTNETRAAKMEDRREHMASTSGAMRADMKARIELHAKKHIEMVVRNMLARLTAAMERFDDIAARIDARLAKLTAEGVDVSAAVALQATAKTKMADAKVAIAAVVKPSLSEDATREEVKTAFESVRAQIKSAEEAVKAAHKALMETVAAMKRAGGVKADASVETTTTTSGN